VLNPEEPLSYAGITRFRYKGFPQNVNSADLSSIELPQGQKITRTVLQFSVSVNAYKMKIAFARRSALQPKEDMLITSRNIE